MSMSEFESSLVLDYDSLGLCRTFAYTYYTTNPCVCNIDYSSGVLKARSKEVVYTLNFKLNDAGYMSEVEFDSSWDYDERGSGESKGKASLSYDAEGHLTEISTSSNTSEKDENGDEVTGRWETVTSFGWERDNLAKVLMESSGDTKTGKETKKVKATTSHSYEYGNSINRYRQFTSAYEGSISFMFLNGLGFVGLLGKGTANLPSCDSVAYECDTTRWDYSHEYDYTLNWNGTIATENDLRYTYIPVSMLGD